MKSTIAFAILILCSSNVSHAKSVVGGVDGGGGIGVRCGSEAPKKFELLDLHEARIKKQASKLDPKSKVEALDLTSSLFANYFWNPDTIPIPDAQKQYRDWFQPIFDNRDWVDPYDKKIYHIKIVPSLALSNDIGQYQVMPGCSLEQIAYFDDEALTLFIAQNQSELDWLDRAALISHELIYFFNRKTGLEYFGTDDKITSERAREFVGQLFGPEPLWTLGDTIPLDSYAVCSDVDGYNDNGTYGYLFTDNSGETWIVYSVILGHSSVHQMRTSLHNVKLESLISRDGSVRQFSTLSFVGEPDAPQFVTSITKNQGEAVTFTLYRWIDHELSQLASPQSLNCWLPRH